MSEMELHLSLEIPCGATARLTLPAGCHFEGLSGGSNTELSSGGHQFKARFE